MKMTGSETPAAFNGGKRVSFRSQHARLFLGIALDHIGKCQTICDSDLWPINVEPQNV
jgi:hypothetical protein